MERLTDVLGHFATGVAVVAARTAGSGRPAALTVRSFASLSLDPPLVLFCVPRTSTAWPEVERAGRFGVSVLAEEHQALAAGGDPLADADRTAGPDGACHVPGALATLDCAVHAVHEAGDHLVVTARVLGLDARPDGLPLLSYRSDYTTGVFP
ncbi:flavin reductase family protein [Streptomyces sp. NPDC053431]|uniref:flavin reductase family protein n=1 Tax=Streptomyces sp. NPDC053431 TaxID=3365703 RepID=UPI0037D054BC